MGILLERTRWLWRYELEQRGFKDPWSQRPLMWLRWMVEHNKLGHGRQDGGQR